ncbi:hypothetical protein OUZ56_007928 [Daphnia magna]|uniref:Transposase n=1 Tax=Daphnia magna TaxID=35525 RepID=A0ABR0ABF3_9CRUS|nr:hypothetical protein OUZ56_007928 [Daphnia magna]
MACIEEDWTQLREGETALPAVNDAEGMRILRSTRKKKGKRGGSYQSCLLEIVCTFQNEQVDLCDLTGGRILAQGGGDPMANRISKESRLCTL